MRVVVPRRSVHECVQRIAIDDEVAFSRNEKELAAAAGKVTTSELIQPDLSGGSWCFCYRRRRRQRSVTGRARERQNHQKDEKTMTRHVVSVARPTTNCRPPLGGFSTMARGSLSVNRAYHARIGVDRVNSIQFAVPAQIPRLPETPTRRPGRTASRAVSSHRHRSDTTPRPWDPRRSRTRARSARPGPRPESSQSRIACAACSRREDTRRRRGGWRPRRGRPAAPATLIA